MDLLSKTPLDYYLGQSIKEWNKKNLWKPAFKKIEGIWSA